MKDVQIHCDESNLLAINSSVGEGTIIKQTKKLTWVLQKGSIFVACVAVCITHM